MKRLIWFFSVSFFVITPVFLPAQTAEKIEEILNTRALSYEQVARVVLEAADVWAPAGNRTPPGSQEAFNFAMEQRWLPANAAPRDEARLNAVSFLIMRSFEIRGGIMYSIFQNPHYAYRELLYQEIIQGRTSPGMTVSGDMLLYMLSRIFSRIEED
jgi:hypothetical protein